MYLHRPEVHPKDTNTSCLAVGPHTSHHCARLSNSFVSQRGDRRRCHLHRGGLDAPLDGPRELRMWGGCANGQNRRHVPKQREWEWKQSFGGGILIFTKTTIKTGGRNWGDEKRTDEPTTFLFATNSANSSFPLSVNSVNCTPSTSLPVKSVRLATLALPAKRFLKEGSASFPCS